MKVAIKFIPLREASESVRREVHAMHKLEPHPNLVRLVDVLVCRRSLPQVSSEAPYICIVTEFVENSEPLARLIRNGGQQPALATKVISQLAAALASIHDQGFVHRDVWSENVLVGSTGNIVLLDLGSTVPYTTGPDVTDRLNIPYAAPEASRRTRQSPCEDCWALGLLLSEIVTGRFICERLQTSNIPAYSKSRVLVDLISETASVGGAAVGKLCTDLLQKDPAHRVTMPKVHAYLNIAAAAASASSSCRSRLKITAPSSQASTQEPSPAVTPTISPACSFTGHKAESVSRSASLRVPVADGGAGPYPGMLVNYLARSNSVSYQGTVICRAADGKGWRCNLDCGETKIVAESDAWRMTPIV